MEGQTKRVGIGKAPTQGLELKAEVLELLQRQAEPLPVAACQIAVTQVQRGEGEVRGTGGTEHSHGTFGPGEGRLWRLTGNV